MKGKMDIRDQHRLLLRRTAQEAGMTPTAIAKAIGVAPSTLNKVLEDGEKHTHVLSTPTLEKISDFRQQLSSGRVAEVNAKTSGNLFDQRLDQEFFSLWPLLSDDLKIACLTIISAAIYGNGVRKVP